jgi:DNA-binding PadR family transcriptional regulator
MKEKELILLGLLKESPKHPYQIKKEIKELISVFVGWEFKSIYYPLRSMEKRGLVERSIEHKKNRLLRYIYRLTPKGERYFYQLLYNSFLNFKRPAFSLDLCFYFLRYLKPKIVKRRLKARLFLLKKLSKGIQQAIHSFKKHKDSSFKVAILEHDLKMIETELEFLKKIISQFNLQIPKVFNKMREARNEK